MYGAIMARDQHLVYTAKTKEGKMMLDKAFKRFSSAAYKNGMKRISMKYIDRFFSDLKAS